MNWITIMNWTTIKARLRVLPALVPVLIGCSDVLSLDVESPGSIADADLNTFDAIPGLVAGMSFDLTQSMDGGLLQEVLLAGGEIGHGGSYDLGTYPQGDLQGTPEDWDGEYGTMQQARWVAEEGLRRIAGILDRAQKGQRLAKGLSASGETEEKIRAQSEAEIRGLIDAFIDAVKENVEDEETRERIRKALMESLPESDAA